MHNQTSSRTTNTIQSPSRRSSADLDRAPALKTASSDRGKEPPGTGDAPASTPASTQFRLAEDAFKPGDRVQASATIEVLSNRDDRVFVTARFQGNPTPVVIDSIWSNCAACDLHVGDDIHLEGKVRRINHGNARKWDTASVLFDGLNYAVALPLSDLEPM